MTSIGDVDNPVMGVIVCRMWWKPWRYSAQAIYYTDNRAKTRIMATHRFIIETQYGEKVTNLTKLEVVGLMRLMGVKHPQFEGAMK